MSLGSLTLIHASVASRFMETARGHIPAVISKYAPPTNAKHIGACSLRFSPPAAFNDPFDGLPDTEVIRLMDRYKAELENAYKRAKQVLGLEGAEQVLPLIEPAAMAGAIKGLQADLNNFRILCLSECHPETMAAAVMMGHYCDKHTGFVYEFATDHDWVRSHSGTPDRSRAMGAVTYRPNRPSILDDGRRAFFVKSIDWSYEKEFRLVRYVKDSSNELATAGRDIATFPPETLQSIILCCNASKETEDGVRMQLESNPALKHVRLFKLSIDPDHYCFLRKEIPATMCDAHIMNDVRNEVYKLAEQFSMP